MQTAYRESKWGWHFSSKTTLLCPSESNHKKSGHLCLQTNIWEWGDADHIPEGPGAGAAYVGRERSNLVPIHRSQARGGSLCSAELCSPLTAYASYLVWKDLGGGFRWPLALPLGLYTFQLTLSWTFLVLFLTANNPGLALLDLLLLYGLVASMVLIWQPINKLAALLLLPYLAWLTVTTAITYRLWRDSLCPAYQP
ncbi:translocator protein 2 isoform X2 [Alexandromys fortis]|uniref:translocator protein 2 isoform X2 n=1 Tax=Alexandromys fortis TaxID=100897 RepID=UPI0021524855|nr:translocator protein 2 isoform X2 [Microtus fortis]XP_049988499.1 translocator protein 2 isoform X2 [Microtus fortis]